MNNENLVALVADSISNEVRVALITGCFSLIISVIAISQSYASRIKVVKADEAAKQTEHIRLKALSALEEIMYNLCRLSDTTDSMIIAIELALFKTPDEFIAHFHPFNEKYMLGLSESHHRYRIYLTPEINTKISELIKELNKVDLSVNFLKNQLSAILIIIDSVYELSKNYLSLSEEIHNT